MATIDDLRIGQQEPGRRRSGGRRVVLAAALVLALAGSAWIALRDRGPASSPQSPPVQSPQTPPESGAFTAAGYIEVIPPGPIVVSSPVEGQVESIAVVPGRVVRKGDPLGHIQDAPYRQEVAIAEASAAVARAHLAKAKANLARDEQVFAKGAVSREVLDVSKAEADASEAELALRNAELARARWRLERCDVLAPSCGVILELFVQPGNWINPRGSGERAGAILSLSDPKALQAWVDVNQRDLARLSVGQPVYLTTDAQPDERIPGRVCRIMPKANLQKNTVQFKVEIPDPPNDLRPEMSVKVTFLPKEKS